MRILLVAVLLAFILSPVHAEIYRWIDDKGTIHFTEDPSTIPEKYREKIKVRFTEEDLMSIDERIEEKKKNEKAAKDRIEQSVKEYEKSLEEEKVRKRQREREYIQYQEGLKADKDQKIRKATESQTIITPIPPQEKRVKCSYCSGKGYLTCSCYWEAPHNRGKRLVVRSDGSAVFRTCPDCRGSVEIRCRNCNGVGYVWKR